MITEKSAQKREAAVLNAVKPAFDKLGNGLDYLRRTKEAYEESQRKLIECIKYRQGEMEIRGSISEEERIRTKRELSEKQDKIKKEVQDKMNSIMMNMKIQCHDCGEFISPVQVVCHKCGAISNVFPYELTETMRERVTEEVLVLSEKLKNDAQRRVLYPEVKKDVKIMENISAIASAYNELEVSPSKKMFFEKIRGIADNFIENHTQKHIEIAVVGSVSSGKSTLINALIGSGMASVKATAETSILAKYRTTKEGNYIKVSFYTDEEWEQILVSAKNSENAKKEYAKVVGLSIKKEYLNKEPLLVKCESREELSKEIQKWTSSSSNEHFFVKEVEIGVCEDSVSKALCLPEDVFFVDTPGLNDVAEFRSQITKKYLRTANWVLACVDDLNTTTTFDFLTEVGDVLQKNYERMIVVATKADNHREQDRKDLQKAFIEEIQEMYGGNSRKAIDYFVFVSAEPYLNLIKWENGDEADEIQDSIVSALSKFGFPSRYGVSVLAQIEEEFKARLGIDRLKEKLNDKVIVKRRKEIIDQIHHEFVVAKEEIKKYIEDKIADAREELLDAQDGYADLEKKSRELENDQKEFMTIKEEFDELSKKIEKILEDRNAQSGNEISFEEGKE